MDAKTAAPLENVEVPVKFKLAGLWTSVMSCYIYGDFIGLYKPGYLKQIVDGAGLLGAGPSSQGSLLAVAILIAVPAVMIFLSLALTPALARWTNIVLAAILTVIVLVTVPGSWVFYIFLSSIEVVLQLLVIWYAWHWPRQSTTCVAAT